MSSRKKSSFVPRVASFPVAKPKKLGSSPNKDVDKYVGPSHKSLPRDYRIPGPSRNLLLSPPGITYMLSDDPSGSSQSQSQALSALGSTPPGSVKVPRKSKLMSRSARGRCLAALQKQLTSSKATETGHVEENATSKGSEEISDIWSWKICHKKPSAKSSQDRTYFRCAVEGCPAKKVVKPSNRGHPSFMKPGYFGYHTCATASVENPEKDIISPESVEVTSTESTTQPFRFKAQAAQEDKNPKRRNSKAYRIPSLRRKSDPSRFNRSELEGLSDSDILSEDAGKAELDTDMVSDKAPGIDTQEWSEYPELNTTSTYGKISGSQFTEEWSFSQDMSVTDDYIQTNRKFEDFKVSSSPNADRSQGQVDGSSFNEFLFAGQLVQEAEDQDESIMAVEEVGDQGSVCDSTKQGLSSSGNVSSGNNILAPEPTRTYEDGQVSGRDTAQELEHLRTLQTSGDVVVAGRVVGQSFELYFLDAMSMSRIVGVGLPYSKTLIQNESAAGIQVVECSKLEWTNAWTKAFDAESTFTILTTRLLDSESEKPCGPVSMSGTEMAQNFGVGLQGLNKIVQYFEEVAVGEQDSPFQTIPLLLEVVKYLLSKTKVCTKDADKGSSQMGSPEEVLTDEFRDVRTKELLLPPRVTIRPSHSSEEVGALPLSSSLSGAPKMISLLTMDFAEFNVLNRIAVEISVDCALEDPGQMETSTQTGMHMEQHDWYHDNINVLLKCDELDKAFLMDPCGLLEMGSDNVDSFGDVPNCRPSLDEATMGTKMSAGLFFSRDSSSIGEALLAYEFSKCSNDDDCSSGVGVPLRAITRGTWELATGEENVPYLFKMERQLIRRRSQDPNHSTNGMTSQEEELYQDYKVLFYVNHAMTHLQRVGNLNKITVGSVNDLMR